MTCIVGYVEKGEVWIGGDSVGANTATYEICTRADKKVFRNGDMIFGFTSSFRMGQILQYSFRPPDFRINPGKTDHEYLCTDFIGELMATLKDKSYSKIENNVAIGGIFLLGYRGNLYQVNNDFQVGQVATNYYACGCGMSYALGAMHCMEHMDFPPEGRIRKALEAAAEFSAYVRGPFNVIKLEARG